MNENENLQPVEKLTPFTKMVMSIGTLPSSFYASMSYYESMVWLYEYLKNQVIPTVNNNAEAVEELQAKYLEFSSGITEEVTDFKSYINGKVDELETYMNNYFTNLDVQQEINNKLDAMALDGTLTNLIKDYIDPLYQAYETQINNELTSYKNLVNSNIASIDNKVTSLTSGSPAGVYATVSALTTADPDHSKIYVVSADGHWYYYNASLSTWSDGGVYQSTSLGSSDVSFNNLTTTLKNYKTINADNLVYLKGYGVYQGQLISDTNTVTSSAFILPKGNTISIDSAFKARITCYDVTTKKYTSDSGSYAAVSNFSANNDYIVRISFSNISDPSSTQRTDGNSSNIEFEGIVPNDKIVQNMLDNLTVSRVTSNTRALSSKIFVGKGTKISFLDNELKWYYNEQWNTSNTLINYAIRKSGTTTAIETTTNENTATTINENCFIEIAVMINGGFTLTADEANSLIKSNLIIDYVPYYSDKLNEFVYTANNVNLEIVDSKFKLNSALEIFNGYQINEYTWNTLLTTFSTYVSNDYIVLPNYSIFYYDITANELAIKTYTTTNLTLNSQILPLLISSYNAIIGGELYNRFISLRTLQNTKYINHIFNSANYGDYSWNQKAFEYSQLLNINTNNIETFLFFTDPHITGSSQVNDSFDEQYMQDEIAKLQKMYNSLPLNYIVCGGDWLDKDLKTYAIWKLGYINGFTNSMFKNFYNIVGNHDTNYQGYESSDSESYTGMISKEAMINLWYRDYGQTYYKFNGIKSTNYVLDSGLDANWGGYWNKEMNMAKWDQLDWFANELKSDDPTHSTVYVHAVWLFNNTHEIAPLSDNVTKIIKAFNDHSTITVTDPNYSYSKTYDFTTCAGHVDYVLCGHTHEDYHDTVNGVLCIATDRFLSNNTVTYDLVLNDYTNSKVYMIRVGTGSNREFNI